MGVLLFPSPSLLPIPFVLLNDLVCKPGGGWSKVNQGLKTITCSAVGLDYYRLIIRAGAPWPWSDEEVLIIQLEVVAPDQILYGLNINANKDSNGRAINLWVKLESWSLISFRMLWEVFPNHVKRLWSLLEVTVLFSIVVFYLFIPQYLS